MKPILADASSIDGWRKSSRSSPNGDNCVEGATVNGFAAIRSSRNPQGPALLFDKGEWKAFIEGAKAGEFDNLAV